MPSDSSNWGRIRKLLFRNRLAYSVRIFAHLLKWDAPVHGDLFIGVRDKTLLFTNDYPYKARCRDWEKRLPEGNIYKGMLAKNDAKYAELVKQFEMFSDTLQKIPDDGPYENPSPCWNNKNWLPEADALAIYGLLSVKNPETYLEVGSGNSTKFARRAISDHKLKSKIISIDPCPRAEVDAICDQVVRSPLENAEHAIFRALKPGDMVFIDCSHRSFANSDVTVFFTEILPFIPQGVHWGIHDIFIPFDYPDTWNIDERRWYNEQYLLMTYLLGNHLDEVLFPAHYVEKCRPEFYGSYSNTFADGPFALKRVPHGTSFWMTRTRRFAGSS